MATSTISSPPVQGLRAGSVRSNVALPSLSGSPAPNALFGKRKWVGGRSEVGWRKMAQQLSRCSASAAAAKTTSDGGLGVLWQEASVTMEDRKKILHQKGCVVWLTGLSGSGKSTVAYEMDKMLNSMSKLSYVLDGDKIRLGLCKGLGYSAADRQENVRRVGETAALFCDAGLITIVSFISPYKADRECVRESVLSGRFVEVFMDVPLEVCEARDCKGLYKLARSGVIKKFTGIDDPYEEPENAEITLRPTAECGRPISAEEMARTIVQYLSDHGFLSD